MRAIARDRRVISRLLIHRATLVPSVAMMIRKKPGNRAADIAAPRRTA